MKKLILHIGMAKTGSSSIQETLGCSAEALRELDVFYSPGRPFNHSFEFSVMFQNKPRRSFYVKQKEPISDELLNRELNVLRQRWTDFFESSTSGTFVISAENLSKFSIVEISRVKEYVSQYFDEIIVLLYVRHPRTAIISQWEQSVKSLTDDSTAEKLLQRTKNHHSYQCLERWRSNFSAEQIIVRSFSQNSFRNGNLIDDFFSSTGLEQAIGAGLNMMRSNQSLGKNGIAFLQEFNKKYPSYQDSKLNKDRGLARRLDIFYLMMRRVADEKLSIDLQFSEAEAQRINKEIEYINNFIYEEDRFDAVVASDRKTELPNVDEIPVEYFIEIVNEYAKHVEELMREISQLKHK